MDFSKSQVLVNFCPGATIKTCEGKFTSKIKSAENAIYCLRGVCPLGKENKKKQGLKPCF